MTRWVDDYIAYFIPEVNNPDHKEIKEGYCFRTEDEQLIGGYKTEKIAREELKKYCEQLNKKGD